MLVTRNGTTCNDGRVSGSPSSVRKKKTTSSGQVQIVSKAATTRESRKRAVPSNDDQVRSKRQRKSGSFVVSDTSAINTETSTCSQPRRSALKADPSCQATSW